MRTLRVLMALGPYALSFVRDQRRWLWWGGKSVRTPEFHEQRARSLVRTIAGLGPIFIKVAQVFAARADLIPEPYLGALGTLVDDIPPMPFGHVARTIRDAYGKDVDEVFEAFERQPVGAASLAQVHRARLGSETVAVKVLRPGIERLVKRDLGAYRKALQLVGRFWKHPHIRREITIVDAVQERIAEEVDFRKEAAYAIAIRKNFEGNPHVIIPRVHEEMIQQRVLVMEFVEGTRIDRLDPATVNVSAVVQTLVELYLQMQLVDGLFHADPHPGNLMLAADGRIVLVDFGAVVRVPLEMRRQLMRTSIAAIRRDVDAVVDGFYAMGLFEPGVQRSEVRWMVELLLENAYKKSTTKERIQTLLADRVMGTLFNSPVVLPQEAVYFGRAAALIEGIGTRYDPYFQQIAAASPVILRMRSRILKSLGENPTPSVEEIASVAGYALGRAARWMVDQVQERVPGRWSQVAGNGHGSAVKTGLLLVTLSAAMLGSSACVTRPVPIRGAPQPAAVLASAAPENGASPAAPGVRSPCGDCTSVPLTPEVQHAVAARLQELATRGGECAAYGAVLDSAVRTGAIRLRPYMWRVGTHMAAGEGHANGTMTLAREIDSLNVGVRTVDDVVWSIEHEAVHIAFQIPSGDPGNEVRTDEHVADCRRKANH